MSFINPITGQSPLPPVLQEVQQTGPGTIVSSPAPLTPEVVVVPVASSTVEQQPSIVSQPSTVSTGYTFITTGGTEGVQQRTENLQQLTTQNTVQQANQRALQQSIERDISTLPPGLRELSYFGSGISSQVYSAAKGIIGLIPGSNDKFYHKNNFGQNIQRNIDIGYSVALSRSINPFLSPETREKRTSEYLGHALSTPQDYSPVASRNPLVFAGGVATEGALSVIPGMGFGKVSTIGRSFLYTRYGTGAARAFNIGLTAGGGALMAPSIIDIGTTFKEGKTEQAIKKSIMFGSSLYGGIKGFQIGSSGTITTGEYKGLTTGEKWTLKGSEKSSWMNSLQKEALRSLSSIKQDIRGRGLAPMQNEPTFTNVRALQGKEWVINPMKKFFRGTRSEVFGGSATEKPSTHDIDVAFRSAGRMVQLESAARKAGLREGFDIKPLLKPGRQTGLFGALKEPSYKYSGGLKGQRFTEQFYRLGESSINLAHKGRTKDIPEATRILDLIYSRTGGVPENMRGKVAGFKDVWGRLEKNPQIMTETESNIYYGKGLGEKFLGIRKSFYKKILPDYEFKTNGPELLREGGSPPSPKSNIFSSSLYGGFSILGSSSLSRMSRGYSPVSSVLKPSISRPVSSVSFPYSGSPRSPVYSYKYRGSSVPPYSPSPYIYKPSSPYKPPSPSSKYYPPYPPITSMSFTPSPSLYRNISGGGGRYYGYTQLFKGYRFRKWKTPRLEDLLKW